MKTLFRLILCAISLFSISAAETLSVEELRLNTAPAFVALGVTPSAVEQPSSPRALATSLFSTHQDKSSGTLLPRNLAFEFAPYWWIYGEQLTWDDYQKENPLQNFARTLTFSLASTETEVPRPSTTTTNATGLGIGLRFSIFKGKPSKAAVNAKNALHLKLSDIAASLPQNPGDDIPVDQIKAQYDTQLKDYRLAIRRRDGFQLEGAAAVAWAFDDEKFNQAQFKTGGIWLTPAYRSESEGPLGDFQLVGVARYLYHEFKTNNVGTFDTGARLVWTIPKKPVMLSAEYVQRFSDNNGTDSRRFAGTIEYQLSDRLVALFGVGQDFKSLLTGKNNHFVMLGFNFAIMESKATK